MSFWPSEIPMKPAWKRRVTTLRSETSMSAICSRPLPWSAFTRPVVITTGLPARRRLSIRETIAGSFAAEAFRKMTGASSFHSGVISIGIPAMPR